MYGLIYMICVIPSLPPPPPALPPLLTTTGLGLRFPQGFSFYGHPKGLVIVSCICINIPRRVVLHTVIPSAVVVVVIITLAAAVVLLTSVVVVVAVVVVLATVLSHVSTMVNPSEEVVHGLLRVSKPSMWRED